jgi:hypothetical protein
MTTGSDSRETRIGRRATSQTSRLCQPMQHDFLRLLPASMRALKAGIMHKINSAALLAFLLTGCASVEGDFPSLAKRPYETDTPAMEPAESAQPVTTALPADLRAKTDALLARARRAHAAFEAALPPVRAVAQSASGSVNGSEVWVEAHMQLSRADANRADAVAALGEIDRLIAGERDKGADTGLIALLSQPQAEIAAMVNEETAEIDRLARLIGL